jgi:chromosome segregation ATPase
MAKKVKETSDKIDQLKSSVKQETAKGDSFSGNSGTSGSRTASLDNLENIKNDLSASQDREAKLSEQLKEANDKIEQMKSESRHSALIESDKKDRERDQDRSDDKDKAKAINDLHKELAKSLEREVGLNKDIKDLKKQLDKARESGSKASVDREVNQDDLKKEIQDTNQKIEGFSRKLSNDVDYSTLNAQELQEKAQEIERMRQAIESAIARLGVLISSITPAQ